MNYVHARGCAGRHTFATSVPLPPTQQPTASSQRPVTVSQQLAVVGCGCCRCRCDAFGANNPRRPRRACARHIYAVHSAERHVFSSTASQQTTNSRPRTAQCTRVVCVRVCVCVFVSAPQHHCVEHFRTACTQKTSHTHLTSTTTCNFCFTIHYVRKVYVLNYVRQKAHAEIK